MLHIAEGNCTSSATAIWCLFWCVFWGSGFLCGHLGRLGPVIRAVLGPFWAPGKKVFFYLDILVLPPPQKKRKNFVLPKRRIFGTYIVDPTGHSEPGIRPSGARAAEPPVHRLWPIFTKKRGACSSASDPHSVRKGACSTITPTSRDASVDLGRCWQTTKATFPNLDNDAGIIDSIKKPKFHG